MRISRLYRLFLKLCWWSNKIALYPYGSPLAVLNTANMQTNRAVAKPNFFYKIFSALWLKKAWGCFAVKGVVLVSRLFEWIIVHGWARYLNARGGFSLGWVLGNAVYLGSFEHNQVYWSLGTIKPKAVGIGVERGDWEDLFFTCTFFAWPDAEWS